MVGHETEQAAYDIRHLSLSLTDWLQDLGTEYVDGSQPVQSDQLERSGYFNIAQVFRWIVEGVQPHHMLCLRVGPSAIQAIPSRGSLDIRPDILQPGEELSLKRADFQNYYLGERRPELTVGFGVRVKLSELAIGLSRGSELSVIDTPDTGLIPILRRPNQGP